LNIIPLVARAVVVSRLDSQNICGLERLFPNLAQNTKLDPVLVANMVPESLLTGEYIGRLEKACGRKADIRIPYDPELLFDDDFRCLGEDPSSLRQGLEKLADILVGE
jgi:hypothetical protein